MTQIISSHNKLNAQKNKTVYHVTIETRTTSKWIVSAIKQVEGTISSVPTKADKSYPGLTEDE